MCGKCNQGTPPNGKLASAAPSCEPQSSQRRPLPPTSTSLLLLHSFLLPSMLFYCLLYCLSLLYAVPQGTKETMATHPCYCPEANCSTPLFSPPVRRERPVLSLSTATCPEHSLISARVSYQECTRSEGPHCHRSQVCVVEGNAV